jgi:putative endonuclease
MAINHYIKYRHINSDVRLDIISIVGMIGCEPEIEHIKGVPLY